MGIVGLAAALGAMTGLRTMSGTAVVVNRLADGSRARRRRLDGLAFAAEPAVARAAAALAAGEVLADKIPDIPARTEPAPLAARMSFAALAATLVARAAGEDAWRPAVVAAATAAASAVVATRSRRRLTQELRVPDLAVALAEDGIVASIAVAVWSRLPE